MQLKQEAGHSRRPTRHGMPDERGGLTRRQRDAMTTGGPNGRHVMETQWEVSQLEARMKKTLADADPPWKHVVSARIHQRTAGNRNTQRETA